MTEGITGDSVEDPCNICSTQTSGKDEKIGIAIAGGGTRAISVAHGILRGLQQQKIQRGGKEVPALDGVDVMSGISGGSWAISLYAFAQTPSDELLDAGRTTDPEAITAKDLTIENPKTMGSSIIRVNNTSKIRGGLYSLISGFNISRAWTMMISRDLFEPVGIPRNKFFASSGDEVSKIVNANKDLKKTDFIVPREEVKATPISTFAMIAPDNVFSDFQKVAAKFEKDAVGSGARFIKPDDVKNARQKNGGVTYVPFMATPDAVGSPYGYGEPEHTMMIDGKPVIKFPIVSKQPWEWGPKNKRFSLELASSMSSSYAQLLGLNMLKKGGDRGLYSSTKSNVLLQLDKRATQKYDVSVNGIRENLMFVDGGLVDVSGVATLVHRKVSKIIYVQNVGSGSVGGNSCYMQFHKKTNNSTNYEQWIKGFCPTITALFGYVTDATGSNDNAEILTLNHIFDDGEARLKELMQGMGDLTDAGHPLVYTLKGLNVINNSYWGTTDGHKVDFTIYFSNLPMNFAKSITNDTAPPPGDSILDADGRFTNEELKNVPEVGILGVSVEEMNMMGYLGSWVVKESWSGLKATDGKVLFEGFNDIFAE